MLETRKASHYLGTYLGIKASLIRICYIWRKPDSEYSYY